jgi:hypothetical protein
MSDLTRKILDEIAAERWRQRQEFSDKHDARHPLPFWIAIVARHAGMAIQDGGLTNRTIFRRQMIRAGAVCAAAVEAMDRQIAAVLDEPALEYPISAAPQPLHKVQRLLQNVQQLLQAAADAAGETLLVVGSYSSYTLVPAGGDRPPRNPELENLSHEGEQTWARPRPSPA